MARIDVLEVCRREIRDFFSKKLPDQVVFVRDDAARVGNVAELVRIDGDRVSTREREQ